MTKLIGNAVIGQSGGPTAVINSSAYGAIRAALDAPEIGRVYGALNGINGILNENLIDLGKEDPSELELMKNTPASALGSCRCKLKNPDEDDTAYMRILEVFKKYNIRYFFYNGGNDSMDTCNKVSKFMLYNGYDCRVIGIPKTIDNDLCLTDHCPGYGSAAKYIATSVREIFLDTTVYENGAITVIEAMGRNAGWLTAAAALSGIDGFGADLICLPEVVFDLDAFIQKVKRIYSETGKCLIVVSEGIRDKEGKYIAEYGADLVKTKDCFGHAQLGGLASFLTASLKAATGAKARGIELSLLQRCAGHCASKTDIDEAFSAGMAAVSEAIRGATDKMVGFEREYIDGNYICRTKLFDLSSVANAEKTIPLDWINETGDGLNQKFIDYALPLIQGEPGNITENGLSRYVKLKKIKAKPEDCA